jgi:two-component system, response regulator / RNA-binding antiterminator
MTPAAKPGTESTPTIVAIAAGSRVRRLRDGLERVGLSRVVVFGKTDVSAGVIIKSTPDAVLMDLGDPDLETFEKALRLIRALDCPTALFVDRSERQRTDAAIEAGVSTYVIDGFKVARLGAVVDMAIARHQARARILSALAANDQERVDRAVIDQAKEILMDRDRMTEDAAYTALRKTAMNRNRRLVEVAQLVIDTDGIKPPQGPKE